LCCKGTTVVLPGCLCDGVAFPFLAACGYVLAAQGSTLVIKPGRQGFVPLVGVRGPGAGVFGYHSRLHCLVQKELLYCYRPGGIYLKSALWRVYRGCADWYED
jgi:hypothetical protein